MARMELSRWNEKGFSQYAEKLLAVLSFVTLSFLILYPVHDPDVFWHLKTGEWIWQHKELPDKDPFSFTIDTRIYEDSARPSSLLKGYWLSQLSIYGLYSIFGIYGIIVFRCLVYMAIMYVLYRWMRKGEVSPVLTLFFLIPSCLVVFIFGGERPNTLSYLIAVVYFYLLNEYISGGQGKGWLLPLLMFLWPLMHGGFLLGVVITGIYLGVKIYRLFKKQISFKTEGVATGILIISMAIPFLHGAARGAVIERLETSHSLYAQSIVENTGPFLHARMADYSPLVVVVLMIFFIAVVIRKFSMEHMLVSVFLLSLSVSAVRYIPFLILLMTPVVAFHWTARPSFHIYHAENKIFRYSMYATVLFSLLFVGQAAARNSVFLKGPLSASYPDDAVEFINAVEPKGDMFNFYDWGGYLIYGLYPAKKVFIDGRGLSLPVFEKYVDIVDGSLKISRLNAPMWRALLDEYNIQMVLVPPFNKNDGRFVMLNRRLLDDPDWRLVFAGNRSSALLFLKNSSQNAELIRRYSLRKEHAYEKALKDMESEYKQNGHWRNDVQMGLVNIYLGRYDKAVTCLERAVEKNSRLRTTTVSAVLEKIRNGNAPALSDRELDEIHDY